MFFLLHSISVWFNVSTKLSHSLIIDLVETDEIPLFWDILRICVFHYQNDIENCVWLCARVPLARTFHRVAESWRANCYNSNWRPAFVQHNLGERMARASCVEFSASDRWTPNPGPKPHRAVVPTAGKGRCYWRVYIFISIRGTGDQKTTSQK